MKKKIKLTHSLCLEKEDILKKSIQTCVDELWSEQAFFVQNDSFDIQLILEKDLEIDWDGYQIIVHADGIIDIKAKETGGLLYGLLAIYNENFISNEVVQPSFEERGLMVDAGRKYFSFEWFIRLLPQLYRQKVNRLQLHFSDNEGFRIESERYPEVVSKNYLSKEEVRIILEKASLYGIQIIPEFDSPGHLEQILKFYPQFCMQEKLNNEMSSMKRALDITNPDAVDFIKDFILEYCDLFQECRYFHLGADEFIEFNHLEKYPQLLQCAQNKYGKNASGLELYVDYTNELAQLVKEQGFIPRVWNDGFYRKNISCLNELNSSIEVAYWTRWDQNMAEIETFIEKGHRLVNFNDNFFYYVLGEAAGYCYPTIEKINEDWEINKFAQNQYMKQSNLQKVAGCYLAVWSDIADAQSENEVARNILPLLEVISKKIWQS